MQFDSEQVDSGSTSVARVIYPVATDCQLCPVGVVLLGPVAHHDASVCDISPTIEGDLVLVDEEYCVGALDLSRYAMGESSNLVAV